jgi:hypothetical protein
MADTSFTIDVAAKAAGVDTAAAAVDRLAKHLTAADTAASQAAEALSAGEASYRQAEAAADASAKSLERLSLKALDLQSKMQAAMDAGDESKFWRLAGAANDLVDQHAKANAVFDDAKSKLDAEATALDGLRMASKGAADQQQQLAKAHQDSVSHLEKATAAADDFRKAQAKAGENTEKALGGIKKLGGPLGNLANTAEDAIEGFGKMSESIGLTGTIAVGASVAVLALAAAAVAAAYQLGKVTLWAVKLADKEKRLDKITEKFKKHTDGLFSKLKIKPLLDGMEDLVDLFDETTVTGRAIKVVFESLFQPLIDGIVSFIPKMRTAFIQFEILVLKALIAIKPFGSTIVFAAQVVWELSKAVLYGLAVGLAAAVVTALAFWSAMKAVYTAVVDAYTAVVGFAKGVYDYFASTPLDQIGIDLIMGLARGITSAGGFVLKAITGVVSSAIDGAKSLLGIASPSKVFAEIGMHTAEGMAVGVEDGTSSTQGALENLVAPPAAPAQASGGSGSAPSLAGATFIFQGVQGAEDAVARFEELLTRFAEGDLAQLGGAVPA